MSMDETSTSYKSGFVAIIGRANVGKSTLLNRLMGEKLSIVSAKPHTTRHKLLGVIHGPMCQAALLDTPGYLGQGRDQLDAAMGRQGAAALAEADLVVLVVEPRPPGDVERLFMPQIAKLKTPALLVLNKVDTVAKPKILPVIEVYAQAHPFVEIVPVSALNNKGMDVLLTLIEAHLPDSEPLFSSDTLTDRPLRFRIGEAIREKVYELYGQEVPYYVAVEVDDYHKREGGQPHYLAATIYVDSASQRQLLIGKGGQALKEVGVRARRDIEALMEHPVYLDLWVKVNPKWRQKPGFVERQL